MRTTCPDCRQAEDRRRGVRLHFEMFNFLRLWRSVNGRKVYKAKCPGCDRRFEIDGGRDPDTVPEKIAHPKTTGNIMFVVPEKDTTDLSTSGRRRAN